MNGEGEEWHVERISKGLRGEDMKWVKYDWNIIYVCEVLKGEIKYLIRNK